MSDPKVSGFNERVGLQAMMVGVEFVEPTQQPHTNRITCVQCDEAAVFYHEGICEHKPIICSTCFEKLVVKTCPHCGQAIDDCREDSEILDLNVFCPLKKDGCEVVLPFRNILKHQYECHPSVDPIKQVMPASAKRLDSTESFKQQAKEDDADLRKIVKELQRKVGNNRTVDKLANQLALLEEKLNREIAAKKEIEKKLLDQSKRKSDVVKQELLRFITEQMNQQIDKQIKESEMNLEKSKQEVVKVVTCQVNKQVERLIQDSRKKIADQLMSKTVIEMQNVTRKATCHLEQHFERQLMDSEKKMLDRMQKNVDHHHWRGSSNIEPSKTITVQDNQQAKRIIHKSTASAVSKRTVFSKGGLSHHIKEDRGLEGEQKTHGTVKIFTNGTTEEQQESQMISEEFNQETEILKQDLETEILEENLEADIQKQNLDSIDYQMNDSTDGQKHEMFMELYKQLELHVETQSQEVQSKVLDELHARYKGLNTQMERYVLEQVVQAAEKQAQGIQKQCTILLGEQIKKEMSEMKAFVMRNFGAEMVKHVAELQKMFAKELKIHKQQLEQANQKLVSQVTDSRQSSCNDLRKLAESHKEDLQKLVDEKFSSHVKNQTAENHNRIMDELKMHKQELFNANQKQLSHLQELNEITSKQLIKKYEMDKDKLFRSNDERIIQQSKVTETELQKKIMKELKLQKLELIQDNQQFITQLHNNQENALKQFSKKAEVDKEKWMKYLEERLNQQMKSHVNALNKQMLNDLRVQKQELLQANQQSITQLMSFQETTTHGFSKKMESQRQGLLSEIKNHLFEQLEEQINVVKSEMSDTHNGEIQLHVLRLQEDIATLRTDLTCYIQNMVTDLKEQLFRELHETVRTKIEEGFLHFQNDCAIGIAEVDGPVIRGKGGLTVNGTGTNAVLGLNDLKREIISEIQNSLFEQFQDMKMMTCDRCAHTSPNGGDDGLANGKIEVSNQNTMRESNENSAVGVDRVDGEVCSRDDTCQVMSHFEHFEAMQRKIFNKQFGKLVNEAHEKIMVVVNEMSVPRREELVAAVTLKVNEQLVDMQKSLLAHIDGEIRSQKFGVMKLLGGRFGDAFAPCVESNGNNSFQDGVFEGGGDVKASSIGLENGNTSIVVNDFIQDHVRNAQAALMAEWHEENSKLIQLSNGNLINNVDHKEEVRRLIKEELASSDAQDDSLVESSDIATTYVWRILNFRKKFESLKTRQSKHIASNEFTIQGTPLKLKAHFMVSQLPHWISLVMGFVKSDGGEECTAKSTYSHRRTFVLVDQSKAVRRRDRVIVREPGFRDEGVEKWMARFYGPVCFAPIESLEDDSIYVKNDTVIIKIILEPVHTLYRSMPNDDGVLFWKIDNYRGKKQAEVDGLVECLYSDYFSTSPKGYRMQIRAYLNGDDQCKSEHLSIYLYFRRGQYDEFIASSFPHKVTFTVLDQTVSDNRKDISKSMESDGHILSAYGFREFALQSEIEMPEYLTNDTLLLKVEVVPLADARSESSKRNSFLYG